jgi:Mut7-C RNAse domain
VSPAGPSAAAGRGEPDGNEQRREHAGRGEPDAGEQRHRRAGSGEPDASEQRRERARQEPGGPPLEPAPAAPRLIADAMLGALARWLRVLDLDTAYDPALADAELVALAAAERRTILSRDRKLLERRRCCPERCATGRSRRCAKS